jgi:hypothetical protein
LQGAPPLFHPSIICSGIFYFSEQATAIGYHRKSIVTSNFTHAHTSEIAREKGKKRVKPERKDKKEECLYLNPTTLCSPSLPKKTHRTMLKRRKAREAILGIFGVRYDSKISQRGTGLVDAAHI